MSAKVILVTGSSSGIGLSTVRLLAQQGYKVFGTSRKTGVEIPGVQVHPLDVCSSESVKACVEAVLQKAGRLDVLINNAGYVLSGAAEDATLEQAKAQFETNFFGVVRVTNEVLPIMRKQKQGHIINISSLAGVVPVPFWGFYNASKFAVEGYSETLRFELKPMNIHVSIVEAGPIKTQFSAHEQSGTHPIADYSPQRERGLQAMKEYDEKGASPDVVAKTLLRIIESKSPKLRYLVTKEAVLFTTLRRLMPSAFYETGIRKGFRLD